MTANYASNRSPGKLAAGSLFGALAVLVLVALTIAPAAAASACTITWVGDTGNNSWLYNSGGNTNWTNDELPGPTDHVCLPTSGTPYAVELSGSATVSELTIESGVTLTSQGEWLTATASVVNDGTLVFDGSLHRTYLKLADNEELTTETLVNNGTVRFENATNGHYVYGDVENSGTIEVDDNGVTYASGYDGGRNGTLRNLPSGKIALSPGAAFTANANQQLLDEGEIDSAGELKVSGSGSRLTVKGAAKLAGNAPVLESNAALAFEGATSASGPLLADAGTVYLSGTIPAGVTLTSQGEWLTATASVVNDGTLVFDGSLHRTYLKLADNEELTTETLVNNGTVRFENATNGHYVYGDVENSGTIEVDDNGVTYLSGYDGGRNGTLRNLPAGKIALSPGAAFTANANQQLVNEGQVELGTTASLTPTSGYVQAAGATTLAEGASLVGGSSATIAIQGGTLSGVGSVGPTLENGATVTIGAPLGTLAVTKGYVQTEAGELVLEVGGSEPGTAFDVLEVGEDESLAGTLRVHGANGFVPTQGEEFAVLPGGGTRTGEFDQVLSDRAGAYEYRAGYSGSGAALMAQDVVPPETTITGGPGDRSSTADTTPTFTFQANEPATFECSVDGEIFAACSGPGNSDTTSPLAPGKHSFAVWAIDAGGNVDRTPAVRIFWVGSKPPAGGAGEGSSGRPGETGSGGEGFEVAHGPVLRILSAKAPKRLRGKAKVVLRLRCNKRCAVFAGGDLMLSGRRGARRKRLAKPALKSASRTLAAKRPAKLVLRFSKSGLRRARRALSRKRTVRLAIVVVARDANGNRTLHSRRVSLHGKKGRKGARAHGKHAKKKGRRGKRKHGTGKKATNGRKGK